MSLTDYSSTISEKLMSVSRKRDVSQFILRLFKLLESGTHNEAISWSDDGTQFIVKNTEIFSNNVLPRIYSHKNFTSFTRQLNMYQFKKHKEGGYYYCYSHPCFRSGKRDLLLQIVRRKPLNRESETESPESHRSENSTLSTHLNRVSEEMLEIQNKDMKAKGKRLRDELQNCQETIVRLYNENKMLIQQAKAAISMQEPCDVNGFLTPYNPSEVPIPEESTSLELDATFSNNQSYFNSQFPRSDFDEFNL